MRKQQKKEDPVQRVAKTLVDNRVTESELEAIVRTLRERPIQLNTYSIDKTETDMPMTLRLFHPGKGTAYAISYHTQRWAESLSGGEKPSIAGIGHYHKIEYLFYRNIHLFQTGTLQGQSGFMRRMNISSHLGGWILYVNDMQPFALLGDTHIGSKYSRLDLLHDFYDRAYMEGVKTFYHTGDLVDGENMYKGQVYEIYAHGLDSQVEEVIKNYPRYSDVTTYFITGNHDLSFWKHSGIDIGRVVNNRRSDLVYLGQEEANIKIGSGEVKKLESILLPYY